MSPESTAGLEPSSDDLTLVWVLFAVIGLVGAGGNLYVLKISWKRNLSMYFLMKQLAIADTCVICIATVLQIQREYVITQLSDHLWRLLTAVEIFWIYLSSYIVACIFLDRFFAALYLARPNIALNRSFHMLCVAYIGALCCSVAQGEVLHSPSYRRHVGFNVFSLLINFVLSLFIMLCCLLYICIKTHRIEFGDMQHQETRNTRRLLTTSVAVFALCRLPYTTMNIWYFIDRDSAPRVSPSVEDFLFNMTLLNSCFNPIVYGFYKLDMCSALRRMCPIGCARALDATQDVRRRGPRGPRRTLARCPRLYVTSTALSAAPAPLITVRVQQETLV